MRCIIKILKSKILPITLSLSLVLGLLIQGSFAYQAGNPMTPEDVIALSNNALHKESDALSLWVSGGYDSERYCYMFSANGEYVLCSSCSCEIGFYNNTFYALEPNVTFVYNTITRNSIDTGLRYETASNQGIEFNGVLWYPISNDNNLNIIYYFNNGSVWANYRLLNAGSGAEICAFNLNASAYEPDSRIFEVWKTVDYPESSNPLEYINVKLDGSVDLNKISTQKIRFDYTDQDGNNLFKVFSESDFHDIYYDNSEDFYTFHLFPYLISSYEFTITGATYYSDLVEWGSKSIDLDLIYNEGTIYPLPQDWNSVYTVNQYFQSRSNGTVNGGVTILALSDSGYLWIDYYQKVCHQAFDVKVLFIPYFMNSDLISINLETLFQLFEQYDVIFTGVQPAQFNLLIPTLDYNSLFTYYSQNGFYPALKKLQEAYVFYSNLGLNLDYSDYSWSFSNDEVGFIVTRSFLLKRSLTALGDIDDRLLEFEMNLVGEDSLGSSLQTKLDNILSLEHDFFTDVSNFFQKLEYNLNGLSLGRIEKYLEDIWSATVGERNFNYTDLLPEPLKSIFLYFRGWFISSTQYMQDFIDVSNSSLYGDDLMKLPFEATVVPVLPFEPCTPTPIPIPTLEAGLIEVGGD